MVQFKDRTLLITGGGTGIGEAITLPPVRGEGLAQGSES